jgi:hypothetical protein
VSKVFSRRLRGVRFYAESTIIFQHYSSISVPCRYPCFRTKRVVKKLEAEHSDSITEEIPIPAAIHFSDLDTFRFYAAYQLEKCVDHPQFAYIYDGEFHVQNSSEFFASPL